MRSLNCEDCYAHELTLVNAESSGIIATFGNTTSANVKSNGCRGTNGFLNGPRIPPRILPRVPRNPPRTIFSDFGYFLNL